MKLLMSSHSGLSLKLPEPSAVSSFHLELPWEGVLFFVDDPAEHIPPNDCYRFHGGRSMSFPRSRVLNRLANPTQIIVKCHVVEGLLL
jgi:hypothetical protein